MHTHHLATTALLFGWPRALAAGQQYQLSQVQVDACSALPCSAEESDSICSQSHREDEVYAAPLVSIADNAVNLTSDIYFSYTIIEEGRTIYGNEPGLESYERSLYAGIPPSLLENQSDRLPDACALMLRYGSQTFPVPDDSIRRGDVNRTTSCTGVIDEGCFGNLADSIRSFNSSNSNTTDCTALAEHVNTQLHSFFNFCTQYTDLVTVTGAPLNNTTSDSGKIASFTSDKCIPVLPSANSLYFVASVRTLVKPEDRIGGDIFGGRQGFTPIITTIYDERGNVSSIQFACMQALTQGGAVLEDTSAASSNRGDLGIVLSISVSGAMAYGLL